MTGSNKIAFSNEFSLLKFARSIISYNYLNDEIKKASVIFLYANIRRMNVSFLSYTEFAKIVFRETVPENISDDAMKNSIRLLRKSYRIEKRLFSPRITYKYYVLLALAYILNLGDVSYNTLEFAELFLKLRINKIQQQIMAEYIGLMGSDMTSKLASVFENTKLEKIAMTIEPLSVFIHNERTFYNLPRRNISVFSTMSAGKSTFINALLGHDYLPSRNEACTAKIVTIANSDYINYCLGYAIRKDSQVFCGDIDSKTVNEWNKDGEVLKIVFEGNLDRINDEKSVTVIHDTPGINYSGNSGHKKITLNHLVDSKPEIIICLLDATQMHTTDYSDALEAMKKTNKKGSNAKVIFIINKADSYDSKKESLKETIYDTIKDLEKHGFINPVIIPVSSQAARLFKMALQGRINFTKKEIYDFEYFSQAFLLPENDYNLLAAGVSGDLLVNSGYRTESEADIAIEGKIYDNRKVLQALFNTGIPVVENILNSKQEIK